MAEIHASRVERKVEDRAVKEAEKAVSCALGDTACVEKRETVSRTGAWSW